MALTTSPAFPVAGLDCGVAVGDITAVSAGTGAATLFTAGSNVTEWTCVTFWPMASLTGGGLLILYLNNGSAAIIRGMIQIPDPWEFSPSKLPKAVTWNVPTGKQWIKATRVVSVGKIGQAGAIHATATVFDY